MRVSLPVRRELGRRRNRPPLRSAALFASGLLVGACLVRLPLARATDVDAAYRALRIFSQVLAYVQESYVDPVEDEELIYGAIQGMLRDLDPHTTFLRPGEYQKLREDTAGEFGGLGIELEEEGASVRVTRVHEGGPAERAGLLANDQIVSVDGEPARQMSFSSLVKRVRGLPGTRVVLGVHREGWSAPHEIPLIRRQVRIPSVEGELLPGDVAHVRIRSFQERTDEELARVLEALRGPTEARRRRPFAGLVLDLRDNPGGLLEEGVKVADRFLRAGKIVRTAGRDPRHIEEHRAHPEDTEPDYPMTVLVNEGSASASEIVAGALQDHARARVVGTRTYGKGSVQTLYGLDNGAGLKLTIARYYTPSGRSIQDTGILPDIVQSAAVDAVEAGPPGTMPPGTLPASGDAGDLPLQAAIDALHRGPVARPTAAPARAHRTPAGGQ